MHKLHPTKAKVPLKWCPAGYIAKQASTLWLLFVFFLGNGPVLACGLTAQPTTRPPRPIAKQPIDRKLIASIILLFGQQTEFSRSLSKPKNSHVNQRK